MSILNFIEEILLQEDIGGNLYAIIPIDTFRMNESYKKNM